jgi:hypothetical protein
MEMERNDVTDQPSWRNSHGVGDEDAVVARGRSGGTGGSSHRWQCYPLDQLGFGVGWRLGGEPRVEPLAPHLLL